MSMCESTWTLRGNVDRFLAAATDCSLRQSIRSEQSTHRPIQWVSGGYSSRGKAAGSRS